MDDSLNHLLPFLLRPQNVARYEEGVVVIGDRRKYPFEQAFVHCPDVESAAQAIEQMVTQGGGPWQVAVLALAMAARQAAGLSADEQRLRLEQARTRLVRTRPTNTALARRLDEAMTTANQAIDRGEPAEQAILDWFEQTRTAIYRDYRVRAEFGAGLVADGDGILTMCFAETAFIMAMALAWQSGKRIRVYTPETRPYLQGARLTAPSLHELGIPVQVIGDSMPAYLMSRGMVQKYFTAADLVTLDGHVVNKIGTFQLAIAAHYHAIPYFVFSWGPDRKSPTRDSIVIETRNPDEMKQCRGVPTTSSDIDALYPAFDITPPHLVAGIITEHGVLSPYDLKRYFG